MPHLSLPGDGNFWPQPVQRDRKEYSDWGRGRGWEQCPPHGTIDGGACRCFPSMQKTENFLKTPVLSPTLTVKCRMSQNWCWTHSPCSLKYSFPSAAGSMALALSEAARPGQRSAGPSVGLVYFACTDSAPGRRAWERAGFIAQTHVRVCTPGGWGLSPAGLPPDLFPRSTVRLSGLFLFASAGRHPRGLQQPPTRTEEEKAPTESR